MLKRQLRAVLILLVALLLSPAVIVHAQSAGTVITWLVPSTSGISCPAHTNCFNSKRTLTLNLAANTELQSIEFEARPAGTALWKNIYTESLSGTTISNYKTSINFVEKLGVDNVDFELHAIVTTADGQRTTSSTVFMRMDSLLPQIDVVPQQQTIINFSNNPQQITQAFTITEPAGNGNPGSGLNQLFFRIYRNVDSQSSYPTATGIEGYVNNLPTSQQVLASFNWNKVLSDGYYWAEYRLQDHSISSEDAQGNATQFNTNYANCPKDNNGNKCAQLNGNSYDSLYFPFVIDTQAPNLSELTFNGSNTLGTVSGPVNISFKLSDYFSWIRSSSVYVNNIETIVPINSLSKTLQPVVTIPAGQFINGNNSIKICASDYAGNNMCSQTNIDVTKPVPVITVDWSSTANGLNVQFSSSVSPSSTAISSYNWSFGDGGTSNQANPAHTFPATGTYTVSLTVNSTDGQSVSRIANVSVAVPVSTNTGSTGGSNTDGNTGSSSGYGVILTSANSGAKIAGINTGTISAGKDSQFYLMDPPPLITYVDEDVSPTLIVSESLTIKNYLWQYGNRKEKVTEKPQHTFSYSLPGTYQLVVSARDQAGVEHVATLTIEVRDKRTTTKDVIVSQKTTPASISLSGLIDFITKYPIFCGAFLLLLLILLLLFRRKRKAQQEAEQMTVAEDNKERPLLADRTRIS